MAVALMVIAALLRGVGHKSRVCGPLIYRAFGDFQNGRSSSPILMGSICVDCRCCRLIRAVRGVHVLAGRRLHLPARQFWHGAQGTQGLRDEALSWLPGKRFLPAGVTPLTACGLVRRRRAAGRGRNLGGRFGGGLKDFCNQT
jgi:hypothetical protein